MRNDKGFTLIELIIIVAIVGILIAVLVGAINPRKAGAAEAPDRAMIEAMLAYDSSFAWDKDSGNLYVIRNGTATWTTPSEVCTEFKAGNPLLKTVFMSGGSETTEDTELRWTREGLITNLPDRQEASCR